ncbi:2-amino-4-hydroxy-6-hydroxymethyldihydropteridine diphosphokinase [Roseibium aquae]|uniref:2-amino-4-hydroxy-6-hydroxymethyldihydropteridine pyrophosphokinase n=1 Tax=Roseibium aquae TaxID=1323746 RepID=A0A916TCE5_9HYPH|nr:2-amino-4-hydroxy-6-hydroxymethyldihydropteridine diphosphokinase [Roseibium aquae]GGB38281.1 2-amino-4-hydroxy-6-hydroxymethyldihydropteridine diphosphokinase [Roseibium aquae]
MVTNARVRAALGLGSNVGDTRENLDRAVALLSAVDGITLVARSSDYRTPPWGPVPQDDYRNICLTVDTTLGARALLDTCLGIEARMGRTRDIRWGPRLIDIDILIFGPDQIQEDGLQVPHPRMAERAFVLVPLAEIWPAAPVSPTQTATEALKTCPDVSQVVKLKPRA